MLGLVYMGFILRFLNTVVSLSLSSSSFLNEGSEGTVILHIPNLGGIRGKVGKAYFSGKPIYHFLGINYALAPSKERRFKPPEKFPPWNESIYNATKMRQNCPQASSLYYPPVDSKQLDEKEDVEDCLVLNVFSPKKGVQSDDQSLPVVYFIHGGSFHAGSAYDFLPDFLLEEDVVLVVVQYRLGILGFLSLNTEEIPGNVGMLDILLGLEWVRENIYYFGGDPSKVTVAGQSAGSAAASSLLVSPLVDPGLLDKMILQSGSILSSWAVDEEPLKSALSMAEFLDCETENLTEVAKCFKNADVDSLIKAHLSLETEDMARCGTSLVIQKAGSRRFLVEHPRVTYGKGKFLGVPVMGGTTREEGTSFVAGFYYGQGLNRFNDSKYFERNVTRDILRFCGGFNSSSETMADYLHNLYFRNKKTFSFREFASGLVDICGVLLLKSSTYENLRLISVRAPAFAYSFNFYGNVSKLRASDPAWSRNEPLSPGVAHSDELGYLFPSYKFQYSSRELKMVRTMTSLWTNFIRFGKPETSNLMWPPLSGPFGPYLRISDKSEVRENIFDEFMITSEEGFLENSVAATRRPLFVVAFSFYRILF